MKSLIIIIILLVFISCSKSKIVIRPSLEHEKHKSGFSFLKISAILNGEILFVTITNSSTSPILIAQPWFGPCSSVYVYKLKDSVCLNPKGSAKGAVQIKLNASEEIKISIPINHFKDVAYRVVYRPNIGKLFSYDQIECFSTVSKNKL